MINVIIPIICGFVGVVIGIFVEKHRIFDGSVAGLCIRGTDGEVYLKITEATQRRLADPDTVALILRVVDANPRNSQPL